MTIEEKNKIKSHQNLIKQNIDAAKKANDLERVELLQKTFGSLLFLNLN